MNSQVYHGLNIHWGISSSFSGVTGIAQTLDGNFKMDAWTGRNQAGTEVAFVGFNPTAEATFEYIVTDTQTAAGNAVVSGSYPERGTIVTVTGETTTNPFYLTNWIVLGYNIHEVNTNATKVILKTVAFSGITS